MPPVLQLGGDKMRHWNSPFASSSAHQDYRPHGHLPHAVAAVTVSGQCPVDSAASYSPIDNCFEFISQTRRFVSRTSRRLLTMFSGVYSRTLGAVVFLASRSYVVARPSVVCLSSVTFMRPTQPVKIFGNVSTPFGTLAIC